MSTPRDPVTQAEHVAEQVAADVTAWVRGHPEYGQLVEKLGAKALAMLAAEAGIPI